LDLCDDEKKALIEQYMKMDEAELKKAVDEEEKKIADAEELFKTEVGKLQEAYTKLNGDKDKTISEVKAGGLGMMKSVLKSKGPDAKDEL